VTPAALQDTIQRFLTEDIVSVERLDVLLFMYRHATAWWSAEKMAALLEMPAEALHSHLEQLSGRNLLDVRIAESVIFFYKPASEDLARLVEDVADAHYRHRDAVVAVLAGRPPASARLFAEAFKLRKGTKRDG
jgi:hypothetical protein